MESRDIKVQLKVKDIIESLDAELIDFRIFYSSGKCTLRCIVDAPEGGITLNSCTSINKKIGAYLEESSCLGDNCTVEINSPGLDRKLKVSKDFFRVKGRMISLWLNEPVEGKEYLEGKVLAVSDAKISLGYKDKILEIDFNKIKTGKEKIEIK